MSFYLYKIYRTDTLSSLHNNMFPPYLEWQFIRQLSGFMAMAGWLLALMSQTRMFPSRPPVANTLGSPGRNATVFTDLLCPENTCMCLGTASLTSQRLAEWSPEKKDKKILNKKNLVSYLEENNFYAICISFIYFYVYLLLFLYVCMFMCHYVCE